MDVSHILTVFMTLVLLALCLVISVAAPLETFLLQRLSLPVSTYFRMFPPTDELDNIYLLIYHPWITGAWSVLWLVYLLWTGRPVLGTGTIRQDIFEPLAIMHPYMNTFVQIVRI
jgi:hypothetical protein